MSTSLQENSLTTLKVLRTSDIGAFLDGGTGNTHDDVLLHKDQQTAPVAIGDMVDVFLYHDPKGRLTASMRLPKMKMGQIGYVTVVNVTDFGAFVDLGTERGIFMPYAGMRGKPKIGENVWVKLYEDKSHRLVVTMEVDDEMRRASKPAEGAKVGEWVEGAIYNITEDGAYIITKDRWIAFLHRSEMMRRIMVGEMIKGRITFVREDGRINISLRPVKETALTIDSATLFAFLQERKGKMPYSDASSPEIIRQKFAMTKAAFKRALGHLMKEGKIKEEDGWTYLTEAALAEIAAQAKVQEETEEIKIAVPVETTEAVEKTIPAKE